MAREIEIGGGSKEKGRDKGREEENYKTGHIPPIVYRTNKI